MKSVMIPLVPPIGTTLRVGLARELTFVIKEDMWESILSRVKDLKRSIVIEKTPEVGRVYGYVVALSTTTEEGTIWASCFVTEEIKGYYLTPMLTYRAENDADIGGWQLTSILATEHPASGWPFDKLEAYL